MKKWIGMVVFMSILVGLCGCSIQVEHVAPEGKLESRELCVQQVEGLDQDFIMGMDASSVLSLEAGGVKFYDFEGNEQDVFKTLAQNGINYIRVRVWNDPFDSQGRGYGGGNCTIDTALEIGKRATKNGMKLLVNFHYSDFWADPGKQMAPKAWAGMEIEEKTQALYEYTRDCLKKLKKAGVDVGMVQIGNETNGAMCGEKVWFNIQYLLSAGSKAVREVFPDALVAVHFANPETENRYADYASKLQYYNVDYDIFASSYYPFWHGTLENLRAVLTEIHEKYGKKVLVMETSYAYTPEDTDFNGNTIGEGSLVVKNYPYSVQGQANCLRDVIATVAATPGGMGVFYWEGTWISAGGASWEENSQKWEQFGSGWASSFAAGYDPEDAGKYYGGCAVDNQALFDAQGRPLESLKVFNLVRYGNEGLVRPDALEDVHLTVDMGSRIQLPQTVSAIMTDNSRSDVAVSWDVTEESLQKMSEGGLGKHEVTGTAQGMVCKAYISVVEFNYLRNHSFESGDLEGWTVTDLGKTEQLYNEKKATDSLTGEYHLHFWSAAAGSVEFTAEQEVRDLAPGVYKFAISIMGGDAGEAEVYAYAKVNGVEVARSPMEITSYGNWDTGLVRGIEVAEGDVLTVGVYVRCAGSGNGAWGKIDDGMVNKDRK